MNIVCLLIWIGWLIYAIFGNKDVNTLRIGLIASSIVAISHYFALIINK